MHRPTQYWIVDPKVSSTWRKQSIVSQKYPTAGRSVTMPMAIRPILAPQFPQVFPPPSSSTGASKKSVPKPAKKPKPQNQIPNSGSQDDLPSLESMMNIDLSSLLPPNFGIDRDDDISKSKKRRHDNDDVKGGQTRKCKNGRSDRILPSRHDTAASDLVIDIEDEGLKRPPYSYSELIDFALRDKGEMLVRDICQWIASNFDYYKLTDSHKWQPSVRHTLTINTAFEKVKKVRGGHLWGLVADKDSARARIMKNHWKKQKIAEYEQASFKRPRREAEDDSAAVEDESSPKSLPADLDKYPVVMEMDERTAVARELIALSMDHHHTPAKCSAGRKSNKSTPGKSTPKSTPAKRCKRGSPVVREPEPEVIKTQTRHGRMASRIDYKEFSVRGKKRSFGYCGKKGEESSAEKNGLNDMSFDSIDQTSAPLSPDYSSEESDDDDDDDVGESLQGLFQSSTSHDKRAPGSDLGTPELRGSPESNISNASKMFDTISAHALRELDSVCGSVETSSYSSNSKRTFGVQAETPTHVVVSDLQDFEPTESAECILASTAAIMAFPSTSEAALILSSLEASPRVGVLNNRVLSQRQEANINLETIVKHSQECSENPLPMISETSTIDLARRAGDQATHDLDEKSIERFSNIGLVDGTETSSSCFSDQKAPEGQCPELNATTEEGREAQGSQSQRIVQAEVPQAPPIATVVEKNYCPSANLSPRMMLPQGMVQSYSPGWMVMDGMHSPQHMTGITDDFFPQFHVIHDVPLSDAWVQKPSNKQFQIQNQKKQSRARVPYHGSRRYEICSPSMPMFLPPTNRHVSPHTMAHPGMRPFSPVQYTYPRFHHIMAPSPIRPEQTMQAVLPCAAPRAMTNPPPPRPPPRPTFILSSGPSSTQTLPQQTSFPGQNIVSSNAENASKEVAS